MQFCVFQSGWEMKGEEEPVALGLVGFLETGKLGATCLCPCVALSLPTREAPPHAQSLHFQEVGQLLPKQWAAYFKMLCLNGHLGWV